MRASKYKRRLMAISAMLILNFFCRQVKKVAQIPRIMVSLDMEQITITANVLNSIVMPWIILLGILATLFVPIALDIVEKVNDWRKK